MHNAIETWNACRGKYIATLEGDDYWTSAQKLKRQVGFLESNPSVSVSGHYAFVYHQDRPWRATMWPATPINQFTVDDVIRSRPVYFHTSSLVLRQCEKLPWEKFADSYCGDTSLLFWHLLHGTGSVLAEAMSVWRQHHGGIWANQTTLFQARQFCAASETLAPLIPAGKQDLHHMGSASGLATLTVELRRAGKIGDAVRCFFRTARKVGQIKAYSLWQKTRILASLAENLVSPGLRQLHVSVNRRIRGCTSRVWFPS
jgi:hypothetical protein